MPWLAAIAGAVGSGIGAAASAVGGAASAAGGALGSAGAAIGSGAAQLGGAASQLGGAALGGLQEAGSAIGSGVTNAGRAFMGTGGLEAGASGPLPQTLSTPMGQFFSGTGHGLTSGIIGSEMPGAPNLSGQLLGNVLQHAFQNPNNQQRQIPQQMVPVILRRFQQPSY